MEVPVRMNRSQSFETASPASPAISTDTPPVQAPQPPPDPRITSAIARGVYLRQRLLFIKQDPSRLHPDELDGLAVELNEIVAEAQQVDLDDGGNWKDGRLKETVEDAAVLLGFCWLSLNERHRCASVILQLIALRVRTSRSYFSQFCNSSTWIVSRKRMHIH